MLTATLAALLLAQGDKAAFAQCKQLLEAVRSQADPKDGTARYKLTDLTAKDFILRIEYVDGKETHRQILKIRFDQIEAVVTGNEAYRKPPTQEREPVVSLAFRSEPLFLDVKHQKWTGYRGEDMFTTQEIWCESFDQADQLAEAFARFLNESGGKAQLLREYPDFHSSIERKMEQKWRAEQEAADKRAAAALKPVTPAVKKNMKLFADGFEIWCNQVLETATNKTRVSQIGADSFTVREVYESFDRKYVQTDSTTVPWHRITRVTYFRSPSKGDPFFRIEVEPAVKTFRRGFYKNDEVEAYTVEIATMTGSGAENLAALIFLICHDRGRKIGYVDARVR